MSKHFMKLVVIVFAAALVSGCAMRSYVQDRSRVDQEMTGNAGCIQGSCPAVDRSNLETTRQTYVLEIVTGPKKIDPAPATVQPMEDTAESYEPPALPRTNFNQTVVEEPVVEELTFVEYTVQEGDTLQKISKKFYNTYQRWNEIYEANKDVLKSPDRIKPGKTIRIPQK